MYPILCLLISFVIMKTKHPVLATLMVVSQTLIVCNLLWNQTLSTWFSYILLLVFLGGMMVLFIYMSSLASNYMIKTNLSSVELSLIVTATGLSYMMYNKQDSLNPHLHTASHKIISTMISATSVAVMLYLLLALVVVVKLLDLMEGPLRKKKN